ncbi:MAG: hypothetical protein J7L43_02285 [Candidatus Aenigmarchaeota archaeon]|nr:hypothetical protein [Candidatus Aenigmarchaeota archaeon]
MFQLKKAVKLILNRLDGKGLISLYYKEREIYAIVESDFDLSEEDIISEMLNNSFHFLVVPICSLEGGNIKGFVKFYHPDRLLKEFPFLKHLYGKRFNFRKDFPSNPLKLRDEALFLIERISEQIKGIRNNSKINFQNFLKTVIGLIRVEAQKEFGFEFDPSYAKLVKHLENQENHLLHETYALMFKEPSNLDKKIFCDKVENYISNLKKRVDNWD